MQALIDKLDGDLEYALRTDGKMAPEECENYEQARGSGRCVGSGGTVQEGGGDSTHEGCEPEWPNSS